jgi:ABC-type arginine transport system permease subunit
MTWYMMVIKYQVIFRYIPDLLNHLLVYISSYASIYCLFEAKLCWHRKEVKLIKENFLSEVKKIKSLCHFLYGKILK